MKWHSTEEIAEARKAFLSFTSRRLGMQVARGMVWMVNVRWISGWYCRYIMYVCVKYRRGHNSI